LEAGCGEVRNLPSVYKVTAQCPSHVLQPLFFDISSVDFSYIPARSCFLRLIYSIAALKDAWSPSIHDGSGIDPWTLKIHVIVSYCTLAHGRNSALRISMGLVYALFPNFLRTLVPISGQSRNPSDQLIEHAQWTSSGNEELNVDNEGVRNQAAVL
jgi:hypothetical protein